MYNVLPADSMPQTDAQNKGVYARFFTKAVKNGTKSKEAGRPIYEQKEYVEIMTAGDKNTIPCFPLSDKEDDRYKRRFPDQYRRFKEGQEQIPDGTPLSQWPVIDASQVEELKYFKIFTVEQLAEITDTAIQTIGMGARTLSEKAKAFVLASGDSQALHKYAEENKYLKDQLALQQEQLKEMNAAIEELKKGKKTRGKAKES